MTRYADAPQLPANINSLEDAIHFIAFIYLHDNLNFHPDDRFSSYVEAGKPFFTPEEAEKRERLRKQAWEIADLYSLSTWVAAWFGFYPARDLEDAPAEVLEILKAGFPRKQDWSPRKKRGRA